MALSPDGAVAIRRVVAAVALAAYLAFAVWAFFLNHNISQAQLWFFPLSVLLWIVLRALRPRH